MAEPGVKLGLSSPSYAWVVVEFSFWRLMMCQAVAEQGGTAVTESAEPRVLDAGSNELCA